MYDRAQDNSPFKVGKTHLPISSHNSARDSFFNRLLILFSFAQWTSPKVHARDIMLSYRWWGEGNMRSSWIKIKVWDGDERSFLGLVSGWIS
jgi:hypothetical protein